MARVAPRPREQGMLGKAAPPLKGRLPRWAPVQVCRESPMGRSQRAEATRQQLSSSWHWNQANGSERQGREDNWRVHRLHPPLGHSQRAGHPQSGAAGGGNAAGFRLKGGKHGRV